MDQLKVRAGRVAVGLLACLLGACATNHALMPTPVLYTGPDAKPLFVHEPLPPRPPTLDLFFVTDRTPAQDAGDSPYTTRRSRSIAFGAASIEFGEGITLDMLAARDGTAEHASAVQLNLGTRSISGDTV